MDVTADNIGNDEAKWKDYNFAAGVFVEPNTLFEMNEEWEDEEFYYSKVDGNDDGFFKSLTQFIQDGNEEKWNHVIELFLELGY
jgi:hypothetical protein